MYSHDGIYLHPNVTWLIENNLDCQYDISSPFLPSSANKIVARAVIRSN